MLRKLRVLLSVLLFAAFAFTGTVEAAPSLSLSEEVTSDDTAQEPAKVWAGEISAGEPEGVLQLDKALVPSLLRQLLQVLHTHPISTGATPGVSSFALGRPCRHDILTKGP